MHFHVSSFAFPSGIVLVSLHLATTTDSNLVYITGSPRSKRRKGKKKESRERACQEREPAEREPKERAHMGKSHTLKNTETVVIVEICMLHTPENIEQVLRDLQISGERTLRWFWKTIENQWTRDD